MNNRILFNNELQYNLDNKGYAIFDFIDYEIIRKIEIQTNILDYEDENQKYGYKVSIHSNNKYYRKQISDIIESILSPYIKQHLHSYKLFGISFGNKIPNKNTKVTAHHEWSLINEEYYRAYTIWVPLVDMNLYNGPLYVFPGSQYGNVVSIKRPINVPYFFSKHERIVHDYAIPLLLRAGEAVIFNQSIIHFSPPNFSKLERPCVMISLKDILAVDNYIYFRNASNIIEKYKVKDDFAFEYEDFSDINNLKPVGDFIGNEDIIFPEYNRKEIKNIFKKMLLQSNFCNNERQINNILLKNKINYFKVLLHRLFF